MTLGQLYLDTTYVYINKKFVPLPKVGSKPQIIIRIEPAYVHILGTMSSTAASSSSSSTTIPSILAIPVSKELTKLNHPLWSAQVLPAIRT
jgi:hypothetical protein